MNDFFVGFEFLFVYEDGIGKVGVVGFCYGGGVVNVIVVVYFELVVGVLFYGC